MKFEGKEIDLVFIKDQNSYRKCRHMICQSTSTIFEKIYPKQFPSTWNSLDGVQRTCDGFLFLGRENRLGETGQRFVNSDTEEMKFYTGEIHFKSGRMDVTPKLQWKWLIEFLVGRRGRSFVSLWHRMKRNRYCRHLKALVNIKQILWIETYFWWTLI